MIREVVAECRFSVIRSIFVCRICTVRQVDLLRGFFTAASGKDVIHLHRHVVAEPSLDAGRHLVAVRSLASGIIDFLRERTIHTARNEIDIARALERLIEGWLGPVEPSKKRLPMYCIPFSLVFRAEPGAEDRILRVASAYEAASKRRIPPPMFGALRSRTR